MAEEQNGGEGRREAVRGAIAHLITEEDAMPFVTAKDGNEIFYRDLGKGTPVVLIHGWPLSGDMWDKQATYLGERGLRVIVYDRRGFGRSGQTWGGYDYDGLASDLNDLLEALDIRGATLVGFSMGGGEVVR